MARLKPIEEAIYAARTDDYLRALTLFLEIYGTESAPPVDKARGATGLSFFGLCVALVRREFRPAIELCQRAIDLEFYHGEHYANLARVYLAAGNRKKAIETAEAGLKVSPEDETLLEVRRQLGVRARPAVPFLDRRHPINVTIGQARHAKKVAEQERAPRRKR